MAKNLDGIKKLNPDDIKKYRKIVLNYIGEKDSAEVLEQKNSQAVAFFAKRVDGVNLGKTKSLAVKDKMVLKKSAAANNLPPVIPVARPVESVKSNQLEAERLREAIKRQEEERKRIKEEERQYQLKQEQAERERQEQAEKQRLENIRLEKEKVKQEKIRQIEIAKRKRELAEKNIRKQQESARQEELKKKEIADRAKREAEAARRAEEAKQWAEKMKLEELEKAEDRRVREIRRLAKAKRREEVARIKQAMKIKQQAAREKRIIKRQKAWRKIKRNLNFKLNSLFSAIRRNLLYVIAFGALFLAIIYIVICLATLRFNNNFTGWVANYLPVPAVITSQGIISYNDFRKIEDSDYSNLTLTRKKAYLAEWIVWRDLRKKYELPAVAASGTLELKYVLDKDFNQIGLSRVNKIDELLKDQNGFEQLSKYADEYSAGAYYDARAAREKFGSAILDLAVGQVSNIIPRADGYYIIERVADKNGQLGLRYIFIKALTLDQYVSGKIGKIKVFILAN